MHDPTRDSALHSYNLCGDQYGGQFDPIYSVRDHNRAYVANNDAA